MGQFDIGAMGHRTKILGAEIKRDHLAIHALAPTAGTLPKTSELPDRIVKG
jgi:hypothetical protein